MRPILILRKLRKKNSSRQNFLWKASGWNLKFKTLRLILRRKGWMSSGLRGRFRHLTSFCLVGLAAETKHLSELTHVGKDCVVCFEFELSFTWKFICVLRCWKIVSTPSRLLISAAITSACPGSLKGMLEAQAWWQEWGCAWLGPSQLLFVVRPGMWDHLPWEQSCLGKVRLLSFLSTSTTAASALAEMMIKCRRE